MAHVSVLAPRCPFCHTDVVRGQEQVGCNECRAWHHLGCWKEGGQHCSVCRGTRTGLAPGESASLAPSEARTSLLLTYASGVALTLLAAGVQFEVLPAFQTFFDQAGLPLRPFTESILSGWVNGGFLLGALLLLPLGSLSQDPSRRVPLEQALMLWLTLWAGTTAYGLLHPLLMLFESL